MDITGVFGLERAPRLALGKVASIRLTAARNQLETASSEAEFVMRLGNSPMGHLALGIGALHSTSYTRNSRLWPKCMDRLMIASEFVLGKRKSLICIRPVRSARGPWP